MYINRVFLADDGEVRLGRLRAKRLAEDDRSVCMERAQILASARERHAGSPRVERQAAILRDLCEAITPVIEPEDVILGRMPECVPDAQQEDVIRQHPELFCEPGLPGCLDSMGIYVPDWRWLLECGVGGIADCARGQLDAEGVEENERSFLLAAADAMESVSRLLCRYAEEARRLATGELSPERRQELTAAAQRCERVSWAAPESFAEALQLMQIVHLTLSCLVGGRDVTPGRLDQYLFPLYRTDTASGALSRSEAIVLLAMFFLRLSQMAGSGTDFDDNVRRTPCKYTHLYVTVGGSDLEGKSCVNELSFVVADAIRLLRYKEPTLLVRWHDSMDRAFAANVAALVRDQLPVTIYNDPVVVNALVAQGVERGAAHQYAHSACHNSIVPGHEAASGPGGFHNAPGLLLLAMAAGRGAQSGEQIGAPTPNPGDIASFEQLWGAFVEQVRFELANTRRLWEQRWREQYAEACPLLPSSLMKFCLDRHQPAWQAAAVSHFNHHLMGLATVVDSLLAIRHVVFDQRERTLSGFIDVLREDWTGHDELREQIRKRLPRYGQAADEAARLTSRVGRMWVDEVEAAARGMERLAMWPGFYSHLSHVWAGKRTMATPDGRRAGDPLSENLAPSPGTPRCSPLSILQAMAQLPFDHTPSGAAILSLSSSDFAGLEGPQRLLALIESYFRMGGLHLHVNAIDPTILHAAMETPERYQDLMVRVAGFSGYFTQLSRDVQLDVVRRHELV